MSEIVVTEPPAPAITIAFALVKGRRPELAVQKLTEIGVDRIVPFVAANSVVRWEDERADRHHARLERVAREAAMQSHRCWLPVVEPVATFDAVRSIAGAALAQRGGAVPSLDRPSLLVGPEGGWSEAELGSGLPLVGLGASVLRAETAALVAGTLLTALRAGIAQAPAHAPKPPTTLP